MNDTIYQTTEFTRMLRCDSSFVSIMDLAAKSTMSKAIG